MLVDRKLLTDLGIWLIAAPLSFLIRFDGLIPKAALPGLIAFTLVGLPIKAAAVHVFRLHKQSWRTVGFGDVGKLLKGVAAVTALMFALGFLISAVTLLPRSVPLIEGALAMLLLFGVRASRRYLHDRRTRANEGEPLRRALIVGAGEAGVLVVREMLRHPHLGIEPLAFVDDAAGKQGLTIAGVKVMGTVDQIPELLQRLECTEVIIAVPSAEGRFIRRIIETVKDLNQYVEYRVMPGVYELLNGDVSVSRLREVQVEDLLRRKAVEPDLGSIASYIDGETILVTGAGGSIGSELVRQLKLFKPAQILLLGRGENSIFEIDRELAQTGLDTNARTIICDVRDKGRLERLFSETRPAVLFHAAAHKHVPLMEANPGEAFHNNVCGTRNLVELALGYGVKRFVNISTDKAVNPSSVMGASKAIAEKVVRSAAARAKERQRFVSVRFGNVLGSRGSVVPHFKKQIRDGGPVTVTHPDMTRYFMTIPEAAQLVLQAGGLAENGRTYVLDMGDPVKIADLAEDLIRLSGLKPHTEMPIVYTGIRPGEKIHEELMTEGELAGSTRNAKIRVAKPQEPMPWDELLRTLSELEEKARFGDNAVLRSRMIAIASRTEL